MSVINRPIIDELERELESKKVTVLTGMRRVGKTTALKRIFDKVNSSNKAFFDLESPLQRKLFEEENYDAVWQNLLPYGITNTQKAYLFLDEIQYLPMVPSLAKYLYDHYDVKFFLTGSSSFYLKNLFPESMAGRKRILEIFPLTFAEFLEFKNVKRHTREKNKYGYEILIPYYREYLEFGGFPEVVLAKDAGQKRIQLEDIFKSYFEKDVVALSDFREISKARDLILLLSCRVGQKADISKIASELEISRITIENYLNFFEQTYFLNLLPKFSGSVGISVRGQKKVYLSDCGMANFLGKINEGSLFEQSVFQNLRVNHVLSYFDHEGEQEIDFVADHKTAIEVKLNPSKADIRTLNSRAKIAGLNEAYCCSFSFSKLPQTIPVTNL